jgi:hypothetical protein
MKRFVSICTLTIFALLLTPVVHAQDQIIPGTKVHLTLMDGLSTSIAHDGDPFTAVVSEPVFIGNELILPAGAKVHGTILGVTRPRLFAMFRGGASMSLSFSSIEVASRIFPAKMSILTIYDAGADSKQRKDLKAAEGEVVQEDHSVKSDVEAVAIGTAGGSTVGLLFSHVLRGTVFGLVGGTAYVVARKGKDVELPAQTGVLVRMDSTVAVPASLLHNASYTTSSTGN